MFARSEPSKARIIYAYLAIQIVVLVQDYNKSTALNVLQKRKKTLQAFRKIQNTARMLVQQEHTKIKKVCARLAIKIANLAQENNNSIVLSVLLEKKSS